MIQTKSLQSRKLKKDGIRICIMRRIKPEYDFDIWYPRISPSEKLLNQYIISKKIDWETFKPRFYKELKKNLSHINLLTTIGEKEMITLLCWEKEPDYCHRSLIALECKRICPKLTIEIK